eukprot:1743645-Amphidinium_carterae.1
MGGSVQQSKVCLLSDTRFMYGAFIAGWLKPKRAVVSGKFTFTPTPNIPSMPQARIRGRESNMNLGIVLGETRKSFASTIDSRSTAECYSCPFCTSNSVSHKSYTNNMCSARSISAQTCNNDA